MRARWTLPIVIGLGVVVSVSTVLQATQSGSSQEIWRPYVLLGALTAGLAAIGQLVAPILLDKPMPEQPGAEPLTAGDPRRIGPYRILARLGAGAMGRAYLATTSTGKYVAIKVIRSEYTESPEFRRRFAREVQAIGKVHSPYTTELLNSDPQAPQPWLATSYVAGPSLQHAVETYGPWAADSVWQLAAGIAEALRTIHAAGVVHRDLKPANILLADDGPRIIDFGIAQAADASYLTATTNRPGTPAFMAPEQALGQTAGPAVDVFALGVVLAYTATGRTPFGEGTSDAVLFRVVHQPPNLAGVAGDLRGLIEACLDKRPARRPTPEQIVQRYHARVGAHPVNEWLPPPVSTEIGQLATQTSAGERIAAQRQPRRRWLLAGTATLALLVALTNAAFQVIPSQTVSSRQPSSPPPSSGSAASPANADGLTCASGSLTGQGSLAQANAVTEWIARYQATCAGANIAYQATGSGAGQQAFIAGTADLVGSDSPFAAADQPKADARCKTGPAIHLPMVVTPIAVAYNVSSVTSLQLKPATLAKIFAGKVTTWNDPAIAADNPGATLPSTKIFTVHRIDSSGTTDNFTKYLAAVAPADWTFGHDKTWKAPGGDAEKGSDGVAATLGKNDGSIGYVEWSFAQANNLKTAKIGNGSGEFVELTGDAAGKTVADAKVGGASTSDMVLTIDYNTKALGAYPIVLVTYEIICEKGTSSSTLPLVKSFLTYASSAAGQNAVTKLGYAPLPATLRDKVLGTIAALS